MSTESILTSPTPASNTHLPSASLSFQPSPRALSKFKPLFHPNLFLSPPAVRLSTSPHSLLLVHRRVRLAFSRVRQLPAFTFSHF